MKVYNMNKTEVLETYDIEKGYLKQDILVTHIPAVKGAKGKGHYKVLKEYPNGGKEVEWVWDIPEVEAVEAKDEIEDIYIYIPYTAEELQKIEAEKEIVSLKEILEKYKEDVEQVELFGMERTDFEEKKKACANIITKLRELEKLLNKNYQK